MPNFILFIFTIQIRDLILLTSDCACTYAIDVHQIKANSRYTSAHYKILIGFK